MSVPLAVWIGASAGFAFLIGLYVGLAEPRPSLALSVGAVTVSLAFDPGSGSSHTLAPSR